MRTLTILFIVALFAVTATANTITAPESVNADGAGHFAFAVVVEISG